MNKKMSFAIDNAEIVDEPENSHFATARIECFNTGKSLHDTDCDLETLKKTAFTIYEKPIVFQYDNRLGDFGTHSIDPINAGFVVPNTAEFVKREDGRTTLTVFAKIWKKYSKNFLDIFKNTRKDNKSVSVEMEIYDAVEENGLLKLLNFSYAAICVLGDYVTEASPGSNIQMLSFAQNENKEYKQVYMKEFSLKYKDIDLSIPKEVQENCKEALTIFEDVENNGKVYANPIALATARHLSRNDKTTFDKIKKLIKRIPKVFDESDILYLLWGGDEGREWIQNIHNQMKDIDNREMSYFNIEKKEEISVDDNTVDEKTIAVETTEEIKEEKQDMAVESKEDEKNETPSDENKETIEEQKEEKEKGVERKFSLNAYADVSATLAYLQAETNTNEEMSQDMCKMAIDEISKGDECDYSIVMGGMYTAMCKMSAKIKNMSAEKDVYMAENSELKQFKMSVEAQRKEFEVNQTLMALAEKVIISDEAMSEMRNKASEFSLNDIDGWKNYCKAKSFDFAIKNVEKNKSDEVITKIGFSFIPNVIKKPDELIWKA